MIEQFKDYATTQAYSDYPKLPKGGYVLTIMGVSQKINSMGKYLQIGMEIKEGENKDFFSNQYKNDQRSEKKWGCNFLLSIPKDDGSEKDGWTKRSFKTFTEALEDSNSNYHFDWDETKWKGLEIGGLFNEREYTKNDGSIGRVTNLKKICASEKIRKGDYTLPEDDLLEKSTNSDTGFLNVDPGIQEELPFN